MIAIFFALSQEITSLKSKVNILKKMRYAHATFYQSEFRGFPLTLVQTGIGKNVSDIIQHLSKCFRIQLMVSSGFAGSINPAVAVGDLVIGKRVLYSSQEALEGEILIDSTLSCDAAIVDLAVNLCGNDAFKSHCGDILTVNKMVRHASVKKTCWKSNFRNSRRYGILRNCRTGTRHGNSFCCCTCNFRRDRRKFRNTRKHGHQGWKCQYISHSTPSIK